MATCGEVLAARTLVSVVVMVVAACGSGAPGVLPLDAPTAPSSTGSPSPAAGPMTGPDPDALTSLREDTRNAIAWAPLNHPDDVTVEGSVPSSRAWSTSKPLVVAAYLDTVVDGDPAAVPDDERSWIRAALRKSDGAAIAAIRREIPDSPGTAMTDVLRSIGDTKTTAPDSAEGTMQWSVREQVRFMAALGSGRVVSPAASEFLLQQMQPIAAHRWGLGAVGARAFKPGWYRRDTETRQMGIVGNYAVAIITAGAGPAVRQSDGDYAHVWQMNRLADLLARRIRPA